MSINVSVIMVNYNTLKLTKEAIDSVIQKTENLSYEIILIDNASSDGSVEFFEKEYKDKIIFIKNNKNIGFGRANNKGINIARGKYVFLLNTDTLLINNAIKILFEFMEQNSKVGICGGNLYNIDLKPASSFERKLPSLRNELRIFRRIYEKLFKKCWNFNYKNIPIEVGYIIGADLMIRSSLLKQVGAFDPAFFMYSEETELTFRVIKAGYKVMSVPMAKIIHLEGASSLSSKEINKFKIIARSKYIYYYKVYGESTLIYLYYFYKIKQIFKIIFKLDKEYLKWMGENKKIYLSIKNEVKNL